MKIDELQLHLTNLAQLVRSAGGGKTATDLENFCQQLQPYRDQNLKDFIGIIAKAEDKTRKAEEALAKTRKPKNNPAAFALLSGRLVDLYQRAADPAITRQEIQSALEELEQMKPPLKDLKALAPSFQIPLAGKVTQAGLVKEIREALLGRKGAAERVEV